MIVQIEQFNITPQVNSIYGDVSREGLLATGALLLGAGGDGCREYKDTKMSNYHLVFVWIVNVRGQG